MSSLPADRRCYRCSHSLVCEHWIKARRIIQIERPSIDVNRQDFENLAALLARGCAHFKQED